MRSYPKTILLLSLVLVLALSGCLQPASTAPKTTPTTDEGELSFPVSTEDTNLTAFATQTAQAMAPADQQPGTGTGDTPQVILATDTPAAVDPNAPAQGGTEPQPTATEQAPAVDPNAGGGTGDTTGTGTGDTTTPAQPQPTLAPTPVVERPATYTLQLGEWPICIARRYNLDMSSFLSANDMTLTSQPAAGTTLTIPATGTWGEQYGPRALKEHPATITVAAGQSVYSLACSYGDVAPESILAANGLASAGDLKTGMTITIP